MSTATLGSRLFTLALFVGCVAGGFERRTQGSRDLHDSAGSFAIEHITVIDGTGTQPQPDMTVAVENGRITYVGPTARQGPFVVSRTIDGRNRFLLPGLIDTHAHVTFLDWVGPTDASTASIATEYRGPRSSCFWPLELQRYAIPEGPRAMPPRYATGLAPDRSKDRPF